MSTSGVGLLAKAEGPEILSSSSFAKLLSDGVSTNPNGAALVSLYQRRELLPALLSQSNKNVDHVLLTYSELKQASERLATMLHSYGVRRGSVVACFLWNSVEWNLFCWAAATLYASFAPLDPRSIDRPNELKHELETLRANVLVVQDSAAVRTMEKTASNALLGISLKIVCNGTDNTHHWQDLRAMRNDIPAPVCLNSAEDTSSAEDVALILFTSGTTSLPKACGHTGSILSSQSHSYREVKCIDKSSKMIMQSPNFHIAGFWNMLCAWRAGAALVIPSPRFEPEATLKAVESQACTHLPCTPVMVAALFDHPSFSSYKLTTINFLSIGSEIVTPDLILRVKQELGPDTVVWPIWGMTEGLGILSWARDDSITSHNGLLPIGRVMPGASVKICEEGNRQPLKRGIEGELHCSGTSLIQKYLNKSDGDRFYTEGRNTWLATGDRALMDEDGRVFILGRYKDIIIRGGENISPAALESCLNGHQGIKAQVIGTPDPVMGEVPVAIVKKTSKLDNANGLEHRLRESILKEFGTAYALAGVLTLEDLGIADFPLTASGKIRKADLRIIVNQYMQQLHQKRTQRGANSFVQQLAETWSQVLGYSVDEAFHLLADSLTVMRFCYEVDKVHGKRISPQQVYENPTIQAQAHLLYNEERKARDFDFGQTKGQKSDSPPSPQDMIPTFGNLAKARKAVELARSTLEALNLDWHSDVEAVYRNNEMVGEFWSSSQRPCSNNIRWAYDIENSTPKKLRQALEEALTRHSTLRSICARLDKQRPVHLVIKPTQRWFDKCITVGEEVNDVTDVRALIPDMQLRFAGPPGPSCRAIIVPIQGSSTLGLIMSVHHSTYDAFSMSAFIQDLDKILSGDAETLRHRTPFMYYADTYNLHKGGLAAVEDARYCASKLKGVKEHTNALWPVKKGPEWLIGDDAGWTHRSGLPGELNERRAFDREDNRPEGVAIYRKDTCLHLDELKSKHNVDASTILKAATSVFNARTTGQEHAVFCNLDNSRSWPFLEKWIADQLPNPLDIAGPTMGCTINILPVSSEETVLAFLARIQEDQKEQSTHANAPFSEIMNQLGEQEGQIIYDIARRQVFNWDPTLRTRMASTHKSLRLLGRQGWLDLGVFWNFGLLDNKTLVGFILYDDAHLRHIEAAKALDSVFEIVHWMTEPANWEKGLGKYRNS